MSDTMILDAIDAFLARDVTPHVRRLEREDVYPEAIVARMRELGLFGATIASEYGGLGLACATYADIVERIARVWMSLTGIFNSHLIMAAIVQRNGTEAQKRQFLPRFAAGELRGGLALTEPDCGTDLQAIRVTARRDGGEYVVNGTKTWISNGIHGACFALLVKTDPSAEPRHRGMSMLLAEKGPGFTVSRKLEKLGYKGIDSAELVFQDYRVSADRLIGGVEGRGLQHALSGLELGRINVAARGVGIAQAALDESLRYAQLRKTFGVPIAQHRAALGRPQVQRDRALVAIEGLEEMAVMIAKKMRTYRAADIAALGRVLYLDDLGAHVGELHRPERAGAVLLHRQDANARERQHHAGFRATSWRAIMIRCSSLVPSPITRSGASRYSRSTGNSVE